MPNFWRTVAPRILKIQWFPSSMLIFGQKSCFLGPTIFKIPQPNWYYSYKWAVCSYKWASFTAFIWISRAISVKIGHMLIPILHTALCVYHCKLQQRSSAVRSPLRFLSEVMKCESTLRILMLHASFCLVKIKDNFGFVVS